MAEKSAAADSGRPVPPYVSYKTVKNFLAALKAGIPSRIDRSVMPSYSGAVQAQVLTALRFLSLIGQNGHPTDKLPALVNSEGAERQRLLQEIIATGYPFLFNSSDFDLKNGTTSQLGEKFSKVATGETVRKCIAFFLAMAKDAGMAVSPHIKGAPKRTGSSRPKKQKGAIVDPASPAQGNGQGTQPAAVMGWAELLLSKFPSFDHNWPDDVKTKWFASFEKLMQSGGKSGPQ